MIVRLVLLEGREDGYVRRVDGNPLVRGMTYLKQQMEVFKGSVGGKKVQNLPIAEDGFDLLNKRCEIDDHMAVLLRCVEIRCDIFHQLGRAVLGAHRQLPAIFSEARRVLDYKVQEKDLRGELPQRELSFPVGDLGVDKILYELKHPNFLWYSQPQPTLSADFYSQTKEESGGTALFDYG